MWIMTGTYLLLAGNEFQEEIGTGRYDASYGQFLQNNGHGIFTNMPSAQTGFIIDGDVKSLRRVLTKDSATLILAAVNQGMLRSFKIEKKPTAANR